MLANAALPLLYLLLILDKIFRSDCRDKEHAVILCLIAVLRFVWYFHIEYIVRTEILRMLAEAVLQRDCAVAVRINVLAARVGAVEIAGFQLLSGFLDRQQRVVAEIFGKHIVPLYVYPVKLHVVEAVEIDIAYPGVYYILLRVAPCFIESDVES